MIELEKENERLAKKLKKNQESSTKVCCILYFFFQNFITTSNKVMFVFYCLCQTSLVKNMFIIFINSKQL